MPNSPQNRKGNGKGNSEGSKKTQFGKGNCANPGGRPKTLTEVQDLARSYTPQAMTALVTIAMSGKSEAARVAAADKLLDRGWGKAAQPIGDGEGGQIIVQVLRLSEASDEG